MTKIFVMDNTNRSTIYLQYNQGSYSNIGIYLCNTRFQIVTNPLYNVIYKEMLTFIQRSAGYHRSAEGCR